VKAVGSKSRLAEVEGSTSSSDKASTSMNGEPGSSLSREETEQGRNILSLIFKKSISYDGMKKNNFCKSTTALIFLIKM
jgi:hypothetical protein